MIETVIGIRQDYEHYEAQKQVDQILLLVTVTAYMIVLMQLLPPVPLKERVYSMKTAFGRVYGPSKHKHSREVDEACDYMIHYMDKSNPDSKPPKYLCDTCKLALRITSPPSPGGPKDGVDCLSGELAITMDSYSDSVDYMEEFCRFGHLNLWKAPELDGCSEYERASFFDKLKLKYRTCRL